MNYFNNYLMVNNQLLDFYLFPGCYMYKVDAIDKTLCTYPQ